MIKKRLSIKSKYNWPLMKNNISQADKKVLIKFIRQSDDFTSGKKVLKFEKEWSKWLGVKYSTFVNSGASANFLSLKILKDLKSDKEEVIVPSFTWNSDIVSILNSGFKPKFVDINLKNLALDENLVIKNITNKTAAVFVTHAMGFMGISKSLVNYLKKRKIFLIEDVCESHGINLNKKKGGTLGQISNFSFYYAHHMSTIEGGMISTNSKFIDDLAKMKRGHGLLRESKNTQLANKVKKKYKDLNSDFIFYTEGFNFRNTEIGAVLGLEQLKRLNKAIAIRNINHKLFLNNIRKDIFFTDFELEGSSNYAIHLILKEKNKKLFKKILSILNLNSIEYRIGSAGGGNQLRQPYLFKFKKNYNVKNFPNTEHMHFYSLYIGNYPGLEKNKIIKLCKILNKIKL